MSVTEIVQDAHFWIGAALVVVLGVMWRLGVPGLLTKTLDDARHRVQSQLDEAQRLREEAETLLAEIHLQHAASERAAAEMLKMAQVDAEHFRAEAAAKLDEDIRRRGLMAERKIALAETQAAGEVKAAAAELAAQAAETVLAARIAGATSDPLIDAGLSRLAARFS